MSLTKTHTPTTTLPDWVLHDGTKYRAVDFEAPIAIDIDAAWAELAGNYVDVHAVHAPIIASYGIAGEPETGPGAVRHCDIDFNGKDVAIKERIIDWVDTPQHKEYTYDVYETKGFPARVFNTWSLRTDDDGQTFLRNVFYFRMKPAIMTRPSTGKIRTAARNSVLGYKYFFETGKAATSPDEVTRRYASA